MLIADALVLDNNYRMANSRSIDHGFGSAGFKSLSEPIDICDNLAS